MFNIVVLLIYTLSFIIMKKKINFYLLKNTKYYTYRKSNGERQEGWFINQMTIYY